MAHSWIGPFSFISMSAPPAPPQQARELEVVAGKSGAMLWSLGVHPEEFEITTTRDTIDGADADAAIANYVAAVNAGVPLLLRYNGRLWNYPVVPMQITPIAAADTQLGVGGVLGNSRGWCSVKWRLLPWVVA